MPRALRKGLCLACETHEVSSQKHTYKPGCAAKKFRVVLIRGPKDPVEYVDRSRRRATERAVKLADLHRGSFTSTETKDELVITVDASHYYHNRPKAVLYESL